VTALTPISSIANLSFGWIVGGLILTVLLIGIIVVVFVRRRQMHV
jgi:hypothetical protein